jgi:CTP synthase (UTP-ammonia lyase)
VRHAGTLAVGLIGDFDPAVVAHRAIPIALAGAARKLGTAVEIDWVATQEIVSPTRVARYAALWCVPASPYRSMDGALTAIRHARESGAPFLGTCGGFQHALVEYARNVLQWRDADHAESTPDAARPVVAPLECALVEAKDTVRLLPRTRIAAAYGTGEMIGEYHCRYGLNEAFRAALTVGPLRVTAEDAAGSVRAVEFEGHPFFVAVLFQPERAALRGEEVPLAAALLRAAAGATAG